MAELRTLQEIAHAQVDVLFDVQALIQAAYDVTDPGSPTSEEDGSRLRRLLRLASEQVEGSIEAFTPHI